MVDTIVLKLEGKEYNPSNLTIQELKDNIGAQWEQGIKTNQRGIPYFKGRCRNFDIRLFPSWIILSGSLCKSFFGNNLETLSIKQIRAEITRLAAELGLALHKASVSRVDFASNAVVQYPPSLYFTRIEFIPIHKVGKYPGTVFLNKGGKKIMFYDKLKECKTKRSLIPFPYKDKNVIRFEVALKPKQHLKFQLTAKDLYNPSMYNVLRKTWVRELLKVPIKSSYFPSLPVPKSYKEIWDQLTYLGILKMGGMAKTLEQIDEIGFLLGNLKGKYYQKKKIKDLYMKMAKMELSLGFGTRLSKELKSKLIKAAFAPS